MELSAAQRIKSIVITTQMLSAILVVTVLNEIKVTSAIHRVNSSGLSDYAFDDGLSVSERSDYSRVYDVMPHVGNSPVFHSQSFHLPDFSFTDPISAKLPVGRPSTLMSPAGSGRPRYPAVKPPPMPSSDFDLKMYHVTYPRFTSVHSHNGMMMTSHRTNRTVWSGRIPEDSFKFGGESRPYFMSDISTGSFSPSIHGNPLYPLDVSSMDISDAKRIPYSSSMTKDSLGNSGLRTRPQTLGTRYRGSGDTKPRDFRQGPRPPTYPQRMPQGPQRLPTRSPISSQERPVERIPPPTRQLHPEDSGRWPINNEWREILKSQTRKPHGTGIESYHPYSTTRPPTRQPTRSYLRSHGPNNGNPPRPHITEIPPRHSLPTRTFHGSPRPVVKASMAPSQKESVKMQLLESQESQEFSRDSRRNVSNPRKHHPPVRSTKSPDPGPVQLHDNYGKHSTRIEVHSESPLALLRPLLTSSVSEPNSSFELKHFWDFNAKNKGVPGDDGVPVKTLVSPLQDYQTENSSEAEEVETLLYLMHESSEETTEHNYPDTDLVQKEVLEKRLPQVITAKPKMYSTETVVPVSSAVYSTSSSEKPTTNPRLTRPPNPRRPPTKIYKATKPLREEYEHKFVYHHPNRPSFSQRNSTPQPSNFQVPHGDGLKTEQSGWRAKQEPASVVSGTPSTTTVQIRPKPEDTTVSVPVTTSRWKTSERVAVRTKPLPSSAQSNMYNALRLANMFFGKRNKSSSVAVTDKPQFTTVSADNSLGRTKLSYRPSSTFLPAGRPSRIPSTNFVSTTPTTTRKTTVDDQNERVSSTSPLPAEDVSIPPTVAKPQTTVPTSSERPIGVRSTTTEAPTFVYRVKPTSRQPAREKPKRIRPKKVVNVASVTRISSPSKDKEELLEGESIRTATSVTVNKVESVVTHRSPSDSVLQRKRGSLMVPTTVIVPHEKSSERSRGSTVSPSSVDTPSSSPSPNTTSKKTDSDVKEIDKIQDVEKDVPSENATELSQPTSNSSSSTTSLSTTTEQQTTTTKPPDPETVIIQSMHSMRDRMQGMLSKGLRHMMPLFMSLGSEIELSSDCTFSLLRWIRGIKTMEPWAVKMLDASSKIPEGILYGTISSFGSYDECLAIGSNKDSNLAPFHGRYCSVDIVPLLPKNKRMFTIRNAFDEYPRLKKTFKEMNIDETTMAYYYILKHRVGLCVPQSCGVQDLQRVTKRMASELGANVTVGRCETSRQMKLTKGQMASLCGVLLGLFLVVLATALDFVFRMRPVGSMNSSSCSTSDESENQEEGWFRRTCCAFSLYNNAKMILTTELPDDHVPAIHGMRFLSISWIMLGHVYYCKDYLTLAGLSQVRDLGSNVAFQVILNSGFAADTFFVISGLLVVYTTLNHVVKDEMDFSIVSFYLRRYCRLTPAFLMASGLIILGPLVGSGPIWKDTLQPFVSGCENYWWTNLFYFSNFVPSEESCVPHGWFLSCDLQFYVISPIIILALHRRYRFGLLLLLMGVFASMAAVGILTYMHDLPPISLFTLPHPRDIAEYLDTIGYKPYTHYAPYCIGMATGYLLAARQKMTLHKIFHFFAWLFALTGGLAVVYGTWPWNSGELPDRTPALAYATTCRTVWAMAVAWVIVACSSNRGGLVQAILSWKGFVPLSRLTYVAYLIHPLLMYVYASFVRTPFYFSQYVVVYLYLGHLCVTFGLSFILSLVFEVPFLNLDKVISWYLNSSNSSSNDSRTRSVSSTRNPRPWQHPEHPEIKDSVVLTRRQPGQRYIE